MISATLHYLNLACSSPLFASVLPSINPDERPNLQDYKDKESANNYICQGLVK